MWSVCIIICFFKQKSSYEMRISDWSSDVCSSDLALAGALTHPGEHRNAAVTLGDVVDQFLDQHGLAHAGTAEQADLAAARIGGEQVDHLDQIGRASWWERVCKYTWISAAAVSLKNKTAQT